MSPLNDGLQRIARLAPLAEVLARVESVARPMAPRDGPLDQAANRILAADVRAPAGIPPSPVALRDGWAVDSASLTDASAVAPAPLSPAPAWIEVGEALPAGADAVLPLDAVRFSRAGAEALAAPVPGEYVLPAGGDIEANGVLRGAGHRLRHADVAVLRAAGIASAKIRTPRVSIFSATVPTRSAGDSVSPVVARFVEGEGCEAHVADAASLEAALLDRDCDAVITIGGTGAGRRDAAVKTLARVGHVDLHGFGLSPGETAALGKSGDRPVLMLPGRLDATLAVLLAVGRPLLARMTGATERAATVPARLSRKVTSTIGIVDLVLVRRTEAGVEPLASGHWPAAAIARADGWIMIQAESEGLAAGAMVEVGTLP